MFDPNNKELLARYIKFGAYYFERPENLIPDGYADAAFFYGYIKGVVATCHRANPQLKVDGTPREVIYRLKHMDLSDDDLLKIVIRMAFTQSSLKKRMN